MKYASTAAFAFALCMPVAAWSAPPEQGIGTGIGEDLAQAREEIRVDLARARAELETDDLDIGNSIGFGDGDDAATPLPPARITPGGDLLIEDEAVAIDARQRQQLLAYRHRVLDIARSGIDIGETAALAAVDAVDRGVFMLLVGAMTGSLERRLERTILATAGPAAEGICDRMPALVEAQRALAIEVPEFAPYARMQARDADTCRNEVRREFARR